MNRERSAWDVIKIALFLLFVWATLGRAMNYFDAQQDAAAIETAIHLTAEAILAGE